jgi:hypothetical protein
MRAGFNSLAAKVQTVLERDPFCGQEAACWAHARRQFYELHAARPNALNTEALERIGALYRIEETIRGKPPDERRSHRREHARPLLDRCHAWLTTTLETLSRKSDTSQAILYALNRWDALTRYCGDGQLEIDNLPVERALRGVAIGRRNYLFAGVDSGGERAAAIYSLVGTAKLNGIDPEAYLRYEIDPKKRTSILWRRRCRLWPSIVPRTRRNFVRNWSNW